MPVHTHNGPGKVLLLDDLAERLGYSKRSLYRMAKAGQLPGAFKFRTRWMMEPEALEALLAGRAAPPGQPRSATAAGPPSPSPSATHEVLFSEAHASLTQAMTTLEALQDLVEMGDSSTRQLIASANAYGITAIYAPRRSGATPRADDGIGELLDTATRLILLHGTTLRGFFRDGPLRQRLVRRLEAGVPVKAVLLDPCGVTARMRVTIEEPSKGGENCRQDIRGFARSLTFGDIERTVTTLREFRDENHFPIEARFIDCTLTAFFILTANTGASGGAEAVLFEPYHLGHEEETAGGVCIGEQVPLLRAPKASPFYTSMWNSFRTIWASRGDEVDDALDIRDPKKWKNIFLPVKDLDTVEQEMAEVRAGHWPAGTRLP